MSKILIIEDEPLILENLATLLEVEGYDVATAENGVIGLEQVSKSKPDLILCDIMMPGMNGYEVIEQLRKAEITAGIPFIFLTAKSDQVDVRIGMQLGADDYLTKPFRADDVVRAVEARLSRRSDFAKESEVIVEQLRQSITTTLPHELRTPLYGILGFVELLKSGIDELSKEQIVEMLGRIEFSANRLQDLILSYLQYTELVERSSDVAWKQENRRVQLPFPDSLVADIAESISSLEPSGAEFILSMGVKDILVGCSSRLFTVAMRELLTNARKFSAPGIPVTVQDSFADGRYEISVTNTGVELSPEKVARIGAFVQFDRHFTEQQGAGLGLAIVKLICDAVEADLSFSVPEGGGGTTAAIRFRAERR